MDHFVALAVQYFIVEHITHLMEEGTNTGFLKEDSVSSSVVLTEQGQLSNAEIEKGVNDFSSL